MPLLTTYMGHVDPAATFWYLSAAPELLALAAERLEQADGSTAMTALAPTLEAFFTRRLVNEKGVSPHTIAAYRDTFRLLLTFAQERTGKQPSRARDRGSRRTADHARSLITSNTSAGTARGPATRGWRRSTRCSDTPRCVTPSTPR